MRDYDVAVVGGGAGGLTAAREATRHGVSVVLVEADRLGGDCTWTGCVPSKALIAAAGRGDDFDTALASVRRAVNHIAATEDEQALRAEGIDVLSGRGRLVTGGSGGVRKGPVLDVDGDRIRARHVVVATGSRAARPGLVGLNHVAYLTNETIFDLETQPASLAVLGGGPIGCELAQAFARLGTQVVLIEAAERLLPREEPEASATVAEALTADGIEVHTGRTVDRIADNMPSAVPSSAPSPAAVRITLDGDEVIEAEALLVAVGRAPNSDDMGLQEAGVELDDRGFVRTDATLATAASGVWAIGDVTGRLPFTHAAAYMARLAVGNALASEKRLRKGGRLDTRSIPWVTFTDPEVGRVGVTEADAGPAARVAYLPLTEVDRAIAADRTRGFVKLIAAPRRGLGWTGGGRIVGATIAAPTGGELIHEPALAMRTGMFTGRLAQTVHAYPTWSMAVQQAAAQFFREIDGRRARSAA